jgi:hypothetical protein
MEKKTEGIYILAKDVLRTLPEPYGEDIIEDVFLAIENNCDFHRRYKDLGEALHLWVVNNWIGKYTKEFTGYRNLRAVNAKRSNLITAYTKLIP